MLEWLASAALMVVGAVALTGSAVGAFLFLDWRHRRRRPDVAQVFDPLDILDPANDNLGPSPAARQRAMNVAAEHMADRLRRSDVLGAQANSIER